VDEDDVFAEAFLSFCAAAQREGAVPQLTSRDNVIRLLAHITLQKLCAVRRREERRQRHVRGESALGEAGFDVIAGREPPPEFEDEVTRLLDLLETDELRAIALKQMQGYSRAEIAAEQGCSLATLDRRIAVIKSRWKPFWVGLTARGPGDKEER
jgi:DNA-directed RNA polymerase specialized sigma24 family protein